MTDFNTETQPPAQPKICLTCRAWHHSDAVKGNAQCRRHAAKADITTQQTFWPVTHATDWCCDWRLRK